MKFINRLIIGKKISNEAWKRDHSNPNSSYHNHFKRNKSAIYRPYVKKSNYENIKSFPNEKMFANQIKYPTIQRSQTPTYFKQISYNINDIKTNKTSDLYKKSKNMGHGLQGGKIKNFIKTKSKIKKKIKHNSLYNNTTDASWYTISKKDFRPSYKRKRNKSTPQLKDIG